MINWPSSLIKEIAQRRCILFLGAGVSASATTDDGKSPPTWNEFLDNATKKLIDDEGDKKEILELISKGDLLLALQAIHETSNNADFQDLLNATFHTARYKPSELHEAIYQLDSRIVITTNFDQIYETYCMQPENEGFKLISYDTHSLADEIRSDIRLIIKAHGTIDNIQKMIFTKQQYHNAKAEHSRFYEILKALFLTHTCIFIGCGMSDPDINLLLEDVKILGSSVRSHYALTLKGSQNVFKKSDWEKTYNVKALEYEPDHKALTEDLKNLFTDVEQIRFSTNA